jgi:hypothetical protein
MISVASEKNISTAKIRDKAPFKVNGQSHIILQQLSCWTRSKVSFVSNPCPMKTNDVASVVLFVNWLECFKEIWAGLETKETLLLVQQDSCCKIIIEHICTFFSTTIDGRNLVFGHKLHIGTPYHGKWQGYHKWALDHSSPCFN